MHVTASPERTDVSVAGVRLSAQRAGAGTPVVYLHGSAGITAWLPYLDAVASRHAVFAPDHPGFGQSEDPSWIRTVDDVAMLYLDLFEELDLHGVHVIAHSLGGWIAAEMAIRDRSRFKSLTLIAPAGLRVKGLPIADNFIWSPEELARALFFDRAYSDALLAAAPDEAAMDIIVRNRFTAAKLGWQPRWYDPTLPAWLHRVRLPVDVMWGDRDQLIPHDYAAHWAARLPNARVTTIERASHLPHVECADRAAGATLAFLKEHDA